MAKAIVLNQYEGMFLLGPSGAEPEKAIAIVRTMIEKHGGQIQVIKKFDERKLAFEIGKQKRGTYILAFFKAAGGAIAPLERDVKLSEEVLRVLITSADHLNETEMAACEPQPIAPPPERNAWDRELMGMGGGMGFGERSGGGGGGGRGGFRDDRPARGPRREETADVGADKE
jgi:small subunit ribosomal protein S6